MAAELNWGIIGAGNIAKSFSKGLARSKTGTLVAVGSRTKEKAETFGNEFGLKPEQCYGSYEALLADPAVQAVYIATPHPQHAEWAIKTAEAKKHVLVEKPIGINHAQAMAMVEAAIANDVFLMEAYMYRCHPQTQKVVDLIRDGAIGEVRMIQASFGFAAGFNPESRLFKNELGGGAILDVGGYPVSFVRLIAGVARGKPFADPVQVSGSAHLGRTGVDESAAAVLKFASEGGKPGIVAEVSTGVSVSLDNVIRVFGADGWLLVPDPWIPARDGGQTKIVLHKKGSKEPEVIVVDTADQLYAIEADRVATSLEGRQASSPGMSWDDTLGQAKTLDLWRQAVGLTYEMETPANYPKTTVAGRALKKSPTANMKYGKLVGVEKPISRFVMGVDNQRTLPHAAAMFDDWFERGGNTFDTSFVYGGGLQERLLGQWLELRGVREQCVTIAKGLHSPDTYPARLAFELPITLDRLRTNYTDLYIMHRDNLQVPVGEFVSAVNEQIKLRRVKAWGGSNWTPKRFEEAQAYAKKNGLVAPVAISNNLSLAVMMDPIWGGCIHSSDPQSRAWLEKTQTAVFAWSSQARGFFLPGNAHPDKTDDAELVRCWYSPENFKRLERANELARKRGVTPINIAAAYVLSQPFPTFALIGPRQLSETRTSLPALDIELSPDEVKWLAGDGENAE